MLAQLAAAGISPQPRSAVVDVDEWKLAGPLPDAIEPPVHSPTSSWDGLLVEVAASRVPGEAVLVTAAAHCAAREIGLFRAALPGDPPQALVRFIAARCGVVALDFDFGCRVGRAPAPGGAPGVVDPELAALRAELVASMDRASGAKVGKSGKVGTVGGTWEGRKNDLPLICWVVAPRSLQTARVAMTADASGRVVIEGELLAPAHRLDAAVTQGSAGVRRCVFQPDVALPRFSATCPVDRSVVSAWIELTALSPGRVQGPVVFSMLAAPNNAPGDLFRRDGISAALPRPCAATAGDVPGALATCINQARAEAGVQPVVVSAAQSQTVARLAPMYFATQRAGDSDGKRDQVALGLSAGWDIPQPRRYGRLVATHIEGAADVNRLVTALLERPLDRAALLDPGAEVIALGTLASQDQHFTGAVVVTYALMTDHGSDQQAAEAQQILRRLNVARRGLGRRPAEPFAGEIGDTMAQARWVSTGRSPGHAIWAAMQYTAIAIHWSHVHGWLREAEDLDQIALPRPLVELDPLELSLGVAHYRPEGEPWTRYVVMFVSVHDDRHAPFAADNDVGYTVDPPPIRVDRSR
jgi:hypothetical protein